VIGFWPSRRVQQAMGFTTAAIKYWVPVCIFVFAYARMIRVLQRKRVGQHGTNISNTVTNNSITVPTIHPSNSLARAQRNLTKTVVLVSVGFVFCWSWSQWFYTLYAAGMSVKFTEGYYDFSIVMISLHCCINPFIYIINYDQFRAAVRKIFTQRRSTSETHASYPT
jgi:hypothetical protein